MAKPRHAPDEPEVVGAPHPIPEADAARPRRKQRLGDAFGLTDYGVNRVVLEPGVVSSLRHWHSHEDEWVMVLEGTATLVMDEGAYEMGPGDHVGFKAGVANGHRLENRTEAQVVYLEVGSRRPDVDLVNYSDEDLRFGDLPDGSRGFMRKNGDPI